MMCERAETQCKKFLFIRVHVYKHLIKGGSLDGAQWERRVTIFFSQYPCVVEQNGNLFHSVHPNRFHAPHCQHEAPLQNEQQVKHRCTYGKPSYFIFFSWVFLVTIACVFPFALSLVRNPSRFHRSILPEVTDHTEPTETGNQTS